MLYIERIKYLLLKNEYYKKAILDSFEKVAETDNIHSIDSIILRYALLLELGTLSFSSEF